MTSAEIIRTLVALGVGGVLVAVVNGLFSKRKLSADATKIITDAASGVVLVLKAENARVTEQNTRLNARLDATDREQTLLRDENRALAELVAVHGQWDQQAFTMLKNQGIELPPPPPLHINPRSTL